MSRATIAESRAAEDAALRAERAVADESLRREREESARVLASLLPLERARTDRFLLTERVRTDDDISRYGDFLGIVSHDLRSLVTSVVISAELLSDQAPEGEAGDRTRAGAARIQRSAARMNRLIGDLVDIASIDAGKLVMSSARGDVNELIVDAVDTFRAAASADGIALEAEGDDRPLPATFDYDRLLQVLANLLTNAIKFTSKGGRIRVRGERDGDEVRISVSDTGVGIPGHLLEAVFERFWQVGKSDRRGVGLGLYISKCIVEAHGGRTWVESAVGQGSTFHVAIPVAGPIAELNSPPVPSSSSAREQ
ncbi:sensor histidine kinase [Polyangium aurulentum]|uniref:sensor histidine kinase n=1 Tax=Polyangium aurulentum TaxID=2567896 RepID=UPI0020105E8A|nr:HAMP domain-containing sensor histidine kinase [Polyangium aurulentum]UQA62211.1 HAMP domain-containing histidine kinase [Polyangium aurulentum]